MDQYFIKYFASVVALLVYAVPLWSLAPGSRGSRDDITQDYIRAMRLLQNTSKCAPMPTPAHATTHIWGGRGGARMGAKP